MIHQFRTSQAFFMNITSNPFRKTTLALAALVATLAGLAGCASSEPAAVAAAPAVEPVQTEYRIGPGDTLQIFVWNHPELSLTVPVRPDGLLSTPLVENVKAEGKTPSQLGKDLEAAMGEYVRSPKVNVIVTTFQGSLEDRIRVVGAAAQPQALPYRAGMTLVDVMVAVGGLSEFAAGNRAVISRREGDQQVRIPVRLNDLLNRGDINADRPVKPGDVIIIPESRF
jgi:polysaccharide export outer membrane protein